MLRPGVLASPEDRNERQVLVLCLPRRSKPTTPPPVPAPSVSGPLSSSRREPDKAPRAREANPEDKPGNARAPRGQPMLPRPGAAALAAVPQNGSEALAAAQAMQEHARLLRRLSAEHLRHLARPFFAAGWTPADLAARDRPRYARPPARLHGRGPLPRRVDPLPPGRTGWTRTAPRCHPPASSAPRPPPRPAPPRLPGARRPPGSRPGGQPTTTAGPPAPAPCSPPAVAPWPGTSPSGRHAPARHGSPHHDPRPGPGPPSGPAGLSIGGRPLSALAWPLASRYAAATPARRAYSSRSAGDASGARTPRRSSNFARVAVQ